MRSEMEYTEVDGTLYVKIDGKWLVREDCHDCQYYDSRMIKCKHPIGVNRYIALRNFKRVFAIDCPLEDVERNEIHRD